MAKFIIVVCFMVIASSVTDVAATSAGIFSDSTSADAHNQYRRKHPGTPDLVGSRSLAIAARDCAFSIFMKNQLSVIGTHPCNPGVYGQGENIYLSRSTSAAYLPAATYPWYNEVKLIDFTSPNWPFLDISKVGHFTQMVWKASTQVGCGWAISTDAGKTIIVCRYMAKGNSPAGSLAIQQNVMPLPASDCKDTNTIGLCTLMAANPSMCTSPSYVDLAKQSCAKTCNYC